MNIDSQERVNITQFCTDCNAIVEAEIIFSYSCNVNYVDELQCEGPLVSLAKCLNCEKPFLLSEDFIEIEGNYFQQDQYKLFPEKESSFVAKAPKTILKPYREAV